MPKFKKVFFIKNPEQLLIIQFYYTNFLPRIGQIKMNVVTFLYSKQTKNAESYFYSFPQRGFYCWQKAIQSWLPRIARILINVDPFLYSKQIKNAESYFDKSDSAFGLSIGIAAYHIGSLSHQFISTLRHQFISTLSH